MMMVLPVHMLIRDKAKIVPCVVPIAIETQCVAGAWLLHPGWEKVVIRGSEGSDRY